MSYDRTTGRLNARAQADGWHEAGDRERAAFLRRLDDSDVDVSEWEAKFLESFLSAALPNTWWTDGRRASCDKMRKAYESQLPIGQPRTSNLEPRTSKDLPAAVTGRCAWLLRLDEPRQRRCGEPATVKCGDLELCADHAAEQARYIARMREIKRRLKR